MSVYKTSQVRGRAADELTPDLYRRWGEALGLQVEPGAKFVVGGDVRGSTPVFLSALVDGLCRAGVDAINLEVLPTPMVHYAKRRLGAAGCAVVTASHHGSEFNGLRWMIGDCPPMESEIARLQEAAATLPHAPRRARSKQRSLEVSFDYVASLQEMWVDAMGAQCRVVLDPMYGCCASRARRTLQAVFPQSLVLAIHDTPESEFGGHTPDCNRSENLELLAEAVYRERAHLGIAFDGDGDRIAVVDNEGSLLTSDEVACILLESYDGLLQDAPFVYDLRFSERVAEVARRFGAEPLSERVGPAFLCHRMRESQAPFGADVDGHYFFKELEGSSDGMFAACRLIAYLAGNGRPMDQLRRACPQVFMTPDLCIPVDPPLGATLLEQLRSAWADRPQTTHGGLRIEFPDGWALARPCGDEPALCFRFESVDWPTLHQLVWRFCDVLAELGDDLWERFALAMGSLTCDG